MCVMHFEPEVDEVRRDVVVVRHEASERPPHLVAMEMNWGA